MMVSKEQLGVKLAEHFRAGRPVEMIAVVFQDFRTGVFTVFVLRLVGASMPFATLAENGDYSKPGTEANSLHSCFRYFFKIEEKEED